MPNVDLDAWAGRFVADNNTWVSAILFPQSIPGRALQRARRLGTLLASQETLEELALVLTRAKFERYLKLQDRLDAIVRVRGLIEIVAVTATIHACRDPKDNKFLELAVSGRADVLVTGDNDLLVLDPFAGIRIITSRTFVEL